MKEIKNKLSYAIVFALIVSLCQSAYADLVVKDFNGVSVQSHLNTIYNNSRREELKSGKIRYEDIEDMIHMFNPDNLNNWNSWENNKSSNDVWSDYQDAADALSGGSGDSEMADAMAKAQADAMRIQADKNYSDSYVDFVSYLMAEKSLVVSTEVLYINYFKSTYDLQNATEQFAEASRKAESVKNNYSVGNATYIDYLNAEKAMVDANSAYVKAESQANTYRRNLLINCGRSMNDNIEIEPFSNDYTLEIAGINFASDYQDALKNNYQYEIYKKGNENAKTTEVKNETKINLDAAPQKIYNDLETKYHAILDALDAKHNKEVALSLAKDTYNKAKNEYSHGSISKKELLSAESEIKMAENNLASSNYDISIAYVQYRAAVDGLATC